jgi:hypothetical protein
MWWINKNGAIEGPLSSEQMKKRVKLNMLRSLDRVSEDKAKWFYVKDTIFWNPTRTIKDPPKAEPPPTRGHRTAPLQPNFPPESGFETPIMAQPAEPYSGGRVIIPDRFKLDAPARKSNSNKGLWIALVSIVVIALGGFGVMAYFIVKNNATKTAS